MGEFQKIWIEQCEAASGIKERFGAGKAIGYLIGEKLLAIVQEANNCPQFAKEIPNFIAEVKEIFELWEIRQYFENVRRVGTLGHVCNDEEAELFLKAGAVKEDPVRDAQNMLTMERIKTMLLE